jgi:hypothetical protein
MECNLITSRLFRLLDDELPPEESAEVHRHLGLCPSCAREWKILSLPRRIGRTIPMLEPSPFFYARLRVRLEMESQGITIWQIVLGLSRQIVPALATVTLVIVSLFAYFEFRGPRADLYQAYDSIFLSGDRPNRMVIADEITDESVLHALAEKPTIPSLSAPPK